MLQDSVIMHKYRNRRHAINLFAFLAIVFFAVITFKSHVIQYSKKIICTQDQSMVAAEQIVDYRGQPTEPTNITGSTNEAIVSHQSFTHVSAAEYEFETTIRSCLGTFCFDEPVKRRNAKNAKESFTRIGILFPFSSDPDSTKEIKLLLKLIDSSVGAKNALNIEVVMDSHVPAYGYGKNHGWSRIIRIVRPLSEHAISLVSSLNQNKKVDSGISNEILDAQIRQLMRWHCRLNHVAAHTAMLTVFTTDFGRRPVVELEKILTFIGVKASRDDLLSVVQSNSDALQATFSREKILSSFLSSSLAAVIADTIENEMRASKDLTRWPCKSFRELEKKLSLPIPSGNLAANCTGNYVTCSVQYDFQGG